MNVTSFLGWLLGAGGNAFSETTSSSIDRANVQFIVPSDSRLYIQRRTRKALNDKAEWLWQNFGIVKEGVAGIARHTVGKGISLQIDSEDPAFNQAGEDDFESYAMTPERCDLAGRRTFYEAQTTGVEQRIIRGEFFCAKANNPEWDNEPCFQLYDSEEVGSPTLFPDTQRIIDGVEINENSRAIRYHVRDKNGTGTVPIDARQMIHWFKPHAINQVRGITDFAQAVNPLVDIHELKRLTTRSAKAHQLIALVLKGVGKKKARGAFGAIAQAGDGASGSASTSADTAQIETAATAAGAGIAYLDAEGDAQLITPNSPTPLVEGFITDLLMRDVCAGWGVPSEFFWNIAGLGGANTRFVLARADLFFQIVADALVHRFCTPIAVRYLQHRIQTRKLREPSDPNWLLKLSWQTPARVTVDNGKDGKLDIELLRNGLKTLRGWYNANGENYRPHMRQWIREWLEFEQELDAAKATPEQRTRIIAAWRAGMPGASIAGQPENETNAAEEPSVRDAKKKAA